MSQKFSTAASHSERFHHDAAGRRIASAKSKAMQQRDASSRGVRLERAPSSKGDALLRKDLYAEPDTPEFSVRTRPKHSTPAAPSGEQGETWGKILRAQCSNENNLGFSKFDPLRTLHFLGKELHSQLKETMPRDSTVFNVISEMQSALKRIPHDIQLIADTAAKKNDGKVTKHKVKQKSEGCQTPNMWYLEPIRLQQHLEESSEKIEKACQQMEILCSKLKTEKENIEIQLQIEEGNSKLLKLQVEEYKSKLQSVTSVAESLKSQNTALKVEVEKQRVQIAASDTPATAELKLFIQDLERGKTSVEGENARLREQLQLAQMETEKYEAMLQVRDVQVKEIRDEMTQLQEVVNEQLLDLQSLSVSGDVTNSTSTVPAQPDCAKRSDSRNEDAAGDPMHVLFNNRCNQYDDAHSGGGSTRRLTDLSGELSGLHLDADGMKLRHVCKLPVAGVAEPSGLREKYLEARMKMLARDGATTKPSVDKCE